MSLLDDELQYSMANSEDDAEFEEDDELDINMHAENANSFAASNQLLNGVNGHQTEDDEEESEAEDAEGDEEEDDESGSDEDSEDEGEAGGEDAASVGQDEEEDEEEDEDESGEEDTEGVGAVKIQPGAPQDDEDASVQDDESDDSAEIASKESSEADSEVEAEWEAQAQEEDEDAETAVSATRNRCIFCEQDEEHDPSEDFEEYLSCVVCGDNSHRQCARDADALKSENGKPADISLDGSFLTKISEAENWRCPGCVANALEPEVAMADATASLSARRSSAPKLARDLLPSQRGAIKPDSHSVFNHLIVDDDPMDGSRLLRKRKTSSAEAEDRPVSPIRKRRKNGSDGSNQTIIEDNASDNKITNSHIDNVVDESKAEVTNPRPSRSLRLKTSGNARVSIFQKTQDRFVLNLRVDAFELRHILSHAPKPKKKRNRSVTGGHSSAAPPTYIAQSYSGPFYSFHDKENDELKSKPYGGILTEAEGDTSKTLPQPEDRRRFDDTRQKSEEDWKLKAEAAAAEAEIVKKPRKVSGPASQIECVNFGGFEIDTWYAAPYPEEYSRNRVLHICEFCLKYMSSEYVAWRHKLKCQAKHPPGDEIYRDGQIAVFEVDGRKNPVYCQNLCLLAKLFLGSKTLYYDVEPFLFYVMTVYDEFGCHFVGYFSKEKRPSSQNNVSCILTLPIHQRKGYGNLLIDFSYLLTRVEKKSGSPEKPLSDMGLVSYRNYWRLILCYQLRDQKEPLSVMEMSERTGMTADDIVSALEGLRALIRDPVTGTYALRLDFDFFEDYIHKWENKKYVKLNPKGLIWTPYIMGRNNTAIMEHAPALNAIAPREGDEEEEAKASQISLPNGDTQLAANGMSNGDEEKHQSELMEIDELSLDNTLSNLTSGMGKGNGKVLNAEILLDTSEVLASSNHPLKQAMSATPKINGFTPPIPATLAIPPSTIPPTRFEIYPPVPGSRGLNRPRPNTTTSASASRSAPRPRSSLSNSVSRSANRRRSSATSSRRSTNSRRRSSTSTRKRTGGTGRGPGRWPKGTKKSDFGNADSGPGLPPRLLNQRSRLGQEVTLGSDEDEEEDNKDSISIDEEDEDAIMYESPGPRRRRSRERRGQGKGKGLGIVMGKGKGLLRQDGDEEDDMEDYEPVTGDIDAEGEDE